MFVRKLSQQGIIDHKPLLVLVVDDSDLCAVVVEYLIKKHGEETIRAHDGQEAVQIVRTTHVDLILMDVQMPVMDGIESTKLIREFEKTTGTHVPVFAVTADVDPETLGRCMNSGADVVVQKPISQEKLFELLETVDCPRQMMYNGVDEYRQKSTQTADQNPQDRNS